MTSSLKQEVHITTPPEEDRATAIGNMLKKFDEDQTCNSEDMITDRQTHRQTCTIFCSPIRGGVITAGAVSAHAYKD